MGKGLPAGCSGAFGALAILAFFAVSAACMPARASAGMPPAVHGTVPHLAAPWTMPERAADRPSALRCALVRKQAWHLAGEHRLDDWHAGAAAQSSDRLWSAWTSNAGLNCRDRRYAAAIERIGTRAFTARAPPTSS